jgi:short-subunit dehydrogenase
MPLNPPLPAWPDCRVWLIGASSGIGAATARALLRAGARVALSARHAGMLAEVAGSSAGALIEPLDYTDITALRTAWQRIRQSWGGVDLVLIVAGTHSEIRAWELDENQAEALLRTNLHGPILSCAVVLPALLAQGHGAIGIVSSVAGYRGLPKALIYGASKAALINFTETLYLDLHGRGLGVYLINPGFVKTPLTDKNEFRMPALISAETAATAIIEGLAAGRFEIHFPRRFTYAMKLLRLLPYRWYFALVRKSTGL